MEQMLEDQITNIQKDYRPIQTKYEGLVRCLRNLIKCLMIYGLLTAFVIQLLILVLSNFSPQFIEKFMNKTLLYFNNNHVEYENLTIFYI
jgi:hypothetical protein